MADDLLTQLQRRNAEIDSAVESARQRLTAVDDQKQILALDESSATPKRQFFEGGSSPLSPSVRAAATASAARRTSDARLGGATAVTRPSSSLFKQPGRMSDTGHNAHEDSISVLEEVDASLPVDIQLKLLRSQCKLARKELADYAAHERQLLLRAQEADKRASVEAAEKSRIIKSLTAAEATLEKSKRATYVCASEPFYASM
jgi:hypothetical protein